MSDQPTPEAPVTVHRSRAGLAARRISGAPFAWRMALIVAAILVAPRHRRRPEHFQPRQRTEVLARIGSGSMACSARAWPGIVPARAHTFGVVLRKRFIGCALPARLRAGFLHAAHG